VRLLKTNLESSAAISSDQGVLNEAEVTNDRAWVVARRLLEIERWENESEMGRGYYREKRSLASVESANFLQGWIENEIDRPNLLDGVKMDPEVPLCMPVLL
jgi:hypothetical protein